MPFLWSWRPHTSWVHVAASPADMALRGRGGNLVLTPALGGLWLAELLSARLPHSTLSHLGWAEHLPLCWDSVHALQAPFKSMEA